MRRQKRKLESSGCGGIVFALSDRSDPVTFDVTFVQGARQEHYKLLQVADLICTVHLIELRLSRGLPLNRAEQRFFGGPRDFKRNVLKKLKPKEI